jgi:anti-sigma factor RsiW
VRHVTSDLGAYTLGALDPEETAAVRRHLAECRRCAAEYDALAPLPGLLATAEGAHAAATEPLSPAFEERLLDAYARDHADRARPRPRRRPRRLRMRWLAVGAAGVGLASAALGFAVAQDDEPTAPAAYDVRFEAVGASGPSARAELSSGAEGTTLHLWVKGLPRNQHAVYEVLCDAPGWTASAGTFRADADGRAYAVLTTAMRRGEYDAIRIVRRGRKAVLTARLP